jgi:hypothetical protein
LLDLTKSFESADLLHLGNAQESGNARQRLIETRDRLIGYRP